MLDRVSWEEREERDLAPYASLSRRSRGRAHPEAEHDYRTVFQRDRDRVIHCTAFRRLEYKTQVFVNHEGDHYRTRLTHTIEVAQIARTLARALNANEDLTEAIAYAHDLGHTPFGHAGEEALRELMKDHGGFEHNLHGLRVVDVLERRYPDFLGLNLSYEVREGIAKHKTSYDHPLSGEFDNDEQPSIEAQIVAVADAIAYDSHDIDDGLAAGILRERELGELAIAAQALDAARRRWPDLSPKMRRVQVVRWIINYVVTDVIAFSTERIRRLGVASADDVRRRPEPIVDFSPDMKAKKKELEDYLFHTLYRHYRVNRMTQKAKRFIIQLFNEYVEHAEQLPPEHQQRVEEIGAHQAVCDYIAGMTDRYAEDEYRKLFQPFERT